MYLRILKNDLKRKKTMNVVLLIFVILAVMFSASSVNNIITVVNGLNHFFEKAKMTDYYIISNEPKGSSQITDVLDHETSVLDYEKENVIFVQSDNFTDENGKKLAGAKEADFSNCALLMSIKEAKLNYFNSKDEVIKNVDEGKVYCSGPLANKYSLKEGDKIQIHRCGTVLELEYAGSVKDAFLGSDMMGNPRCILNEEDYRKLYDNPKVQESYRGGIYYINTNDISALEKAVADVGNIMFDGTKATIKTTYVMNMLVAGLLMIVSICLILVSFVVLRFTIGFTISEEFREIGVMKAIGVKNNNIRKLYLVKYLGIVIAGGIVGYIGSVPFGKMLLAAVSKNMVLNNENSVLVGILCAMAVGGVILLFCWNCTRKIKKLSPVDAVRDGQTGERFSKKGVLHLGKSRFNTSCFLSLNDILSRPKQFSVITIVFTICMLLVMILANTANTLNSEKLLFLFGTVESDLYYTDTGRVMDVMGGSTDFDAEYSDIEKILEKNHMPAKVHSERMYKLPVEKDNKKLNINFQQCKETKASDYTYSEGTAPEYENEIALSKPMAEKLNAKIGDQVKINIDGKEKNYIVTALFQSFCQLGECGRLSEKVSLPDQKIISALSFQIDFKDHPDRNVIEKRKEKLKEIFETSKVLDSQEFVKESTGVADVINGVKQMVLILSVIITAMISILMERSFITREKSEIALMKAVGIKSRFIIGMHTLRFVMVGVGAALVSAVLCYPLTKLCIDPIFSMMGAVNGIEYEIRVGEIFALYPLIILVAIVSGAFTTALYTKMIKASDVSDIE